MTSRARAQAVGQGLAEEEADDSDGEPGPAAGARRPGPVKKGGAGGASRHAPY